MFNIQRNIQWHHFLCSFKQRVARLNPVDYWFALHLWFKGFHLVGKRSLSLNEVNLGEEAIAVEKFSHVWAHFLGKLCENAYYLLSLLVLQFAYAVVCFNYLSRFNIYRASCGTLVVHNTRNLAFQSRGNRYYEATVAHGWGSILVNHSFHLCCAQNVA